MKLRYYQKESTDAVIKYIKSLKNPVVSAATGTGKSVCIASLIHRLNAANNGLRVMVACHVAKLLKQNAEKLLSFNPSYDIGFYSDSIGEKSLHNKFIFAGIQSVFRKKDIGFFNVLIVDEAHTISRKDESMWHSLINNLKEINPKLIIIGYSATAWREDSGSLTEGEDAIFDDIVYDYGLGRAVQDGFLCRITSKYTKLQYDISKVGKVAGEFNQGQLQAATNVDHLTKAAVTETIEKAHDRRAWIAFCNGIEHSYAVRDELIRQGIPATTVTGDTPEDERDEILKDFENGVYRCVTNNGVWTTGVDVPFVDCIVMLRQTMSSGLLLQMAGRGTRVMIDLTPYETAAERRKAIAESLKPNCLMLDFAGNIKRHGFLDEIKPKDKKEKGDGVAPMKICDACATICHAAARKCPDCGFEFPINTIQIIGSAYDGEVLSSGRGIEKKVLNVYYSPHNLNKEGKTPCLRVTYSHPDGSTTNDWICIQHKGFARKKAMKWWNERQGPYIGEEGEFDDLVKFVCDNKMYEVLKMPYKIYVKKDGKYDKIVSYDFNAPEPSAEEEQYDIDF